jgi:hypothetical protein
MEMFRLLIGPDDGANTAQLCVRVRWKAVS